MHQIEAEFTFAAAHRLPRYQGKCFNLHGHNYRFQVALRGDPDPYTGMFVDFGDVEKTVKERPANATHWSVRSMAEEMGISHTSVQRIWAEHGLKPHLVRSFKISNDPDFVAKVEDIVGLYVDPPEKALVLSVDEKSQIQALDRTQPGLPLKKGRAGTMTHDYKRNGTTTPSASSSSIFFGLLVRRSTDRTPRCCSIRAAMSYRRRSSPNPSARFASYVSAPLACSA